jgi:hypothetical protein
MSHDLSLAQNHPWNLACTLMTPSSSSKLAMAALRWKMTG